MLIVGCSSKDSDEKSTTKAENNESSSETGTGAATTEPVAKLDDCTITFWYTYGDAEEEVLLNKVIPMWEKIHPEVTVDCVRQDSSQYNEMIVTSFGTGQGPDVARIDITNTAAYAAQGGLVALSDMSDFKDISSKYLDAPLSTNLYKDSYYGLPLDTNCKAAVVNTTILKKELGLDKLPDTMEELIKAAEKRGSYSLSVSGFGDWDMYPYFWLFGGKLTNDEFTKASGYLDSDDSVKAIETIKSLHDKNILTIKELDGSADAWDGIESDYAMFLEGPWYGFADKASQGIVAATVPTYNGKSSSVVGGENIAVFSTSDNQKASYEFAKFMTSEDVQLAMLDAGQLPVLKSLVNNEKITSNSVWSVYMKQIESAKARIPSPNNTDIETFWKDAMTNIFLNGSDVKSELQNAAQQIDGVLK